jgi:hypothetical protein
VLMEVLTEPVLVGVDASSVPEFSGTDEHAANKTKMAGIVMYFSTIISLSSSAWLHDALRSLSTSIYRVSIYSGYVNICAVSAACSEYGLLVRFRAKCARDL